jgi:hypothetical protein
MHVGSRRVPTGYAGVGRLKCFDCQKFDMMDEVSF